MQLKKMLQGGAATTAMLCLVSLGAMAQTSNDNQTAQPSQNQSMSSSSSSNSGSSSAKLSAADKMFVKKAAQGGMAEVELGQLATQKAQSDDVKKFGQRMVDDHTKANDQLKQIASQEGVQVPTSLDAKDQALKDHLSKLSGEQFDRMYMQHMVQDHRQDIAEFQKEANSGKDQSVKDFASQTLPTLQSHLKEAQQVHQAEMKQGSNSKKSSTSASNSQPQQ